MGQDRITNRGAAPGTAKYGDGAAGAAAGNPAGAAASADRTDRVVSGKITRERKRVVAGRISKRTLQLNSVRAASVMEKQRASAITGRTKLD